MRVSTRMSTDRCWSAMISMSSPTSAKTPSVEAVRSGWRAAARRSLPAPHICDHDTVERVGSGSPYEKSVGFSRATRVGLHVHVSGTAPVWPDGHVDPDPLVQARRCWEIALTALAELGGRAEFVTRTRQFITDRAVTDAVSA